MQQQTGQEGQQSPYYRPPLAAQRLLAAGAGFSQDVTVTIVVIQAVVEDRLHAADARHPVHARLQESIGRFTAAGLAIKGCTCRVGRRAVGVTAAAEKGAVAWRLWNG